MSLKSTQTNHGLNLSVLKWKGLGMGHRIILEGKLWYELSQLENADKRPKGRYNINNDHG